MNTDLEKLIRLHQAESETKRIDGELAAIPHARGELDARLAAERARLEALRAALDASAKARRAHEAAVQDLETKRSKYKGQLMDVKTNKEYTAILHEIEAVEREIRGREDQTIEEMEKADGLAQDVKREEAAFKLVEQAARAERATLDEREARLKDEASRAHSEREQAAGAVPEDVRARYERVAKLRGTGVAEARDGICQTCHVKLRVQVWVELRKQESLIECDSCSRILYYEPPPPTLAVEP
jgi:uncharacterized protein